MNVKPKSSIWIVVGDKSKIESGIEIPGYIVIDIDCDRNIIMWFLTTSATK